MLKVLAMRDTYHVSGPCRGILHLVEETRSKEVQFIIGMFVVGCRLTTPAIEEFKRRGLQLAVWSQSRRYDPSLLFKVWKTVREHNIRILQSHGYKPAVLAWCLKHLTRLPWVAVVHGHTNENTRVKLYNKLDLWLTRSADRVVVVSTATGCFLEQHGIHKRRIRVIPNAIDPEAYRPDKGGAEFRQRCDVEHHELLVGIIGRLSPEKGIENFLNALKKVFLIMPTVKAVVVGEGQEAERLKTLTHDMQIDGRVTFSGYQAEISSIYSALDLVVISSLSEGLPNVLLEAFLHRKAVVATAVGGIPEVMQGELSRWLVPPGDVDALSDVMIQALKSSALRARLGEVGAKLVQEKFTPARRASLFLDVYREVMSLHT
jgi:glycosyltransferase involved in cell wall biosynthesis